MKHLQPTMLATAALACCALAIADGVDEESLRQPTTGKFTVSPPTAEAAALARHAEASFDYASGRATYSFPLYALSGDGVSLQIALSCQAGALKADEEPGMAGAGWSLSLGGYVSRSISGRPDEESGVTPFSGPGSPSTDHEYLRSLVLDKADGAYDRYSYQAGASSGQFVIDRYGNAIQLPQTDNKIEKIGNGFRITTPDGVSYRYEADEAVTRVSHKMNLDATPRNGDYENATRRWRLASITNPQRTDSITFAYGNPMPDREYTESKQRTRSASMQHPTTATGGEVKEAGGNQGLPENYTSYLYSGHRRLQSIKWRSGSLLVDYEDNLTDAVSELSVKDNSDSEAVKVSFDYGDSFVSGTGRNHYKTGGTGTSANNTHRLLTGFRVTRDGVAVDGAGFEYCKQGTDMRSKDLFGYCNGASAPSGSVSVLGFDSNGKIILSAARAPSFEDACRNALRKITSISGGVTELAYEPNTIPGALGLGGMERATDLTVGIRLKSETVSDASTGSVRVREFSYSAPVPSISFSPIGVEPFVSVGGTITDILPGGGGGETIRAAAAAQTISTGVSLLAGSRSPGAPIEGACIYYGRVDEKISGTGLAQPLLSTYEFDLSEAACKYVFGNESPIPREFPDLKYCGTGHGDGLYSATLAGTVNSEWLQLFRPMVLTSYFRESFGEKAPLVKLTQWRITATGDTIPYKITENKYGNATGDSREKEVVLGYYCESLVRNVKIIGIEYEDNSPSLDDFIHYPVKAKTYRLHLSKTEVTEYGDDGSSRKKTFDYDYNDLYTDVPHLTMLDGIPHIMWGPPGVKNTQVPNGLLRRQAISCAGDTASAIHLYACDQTGAEYKDAQASWWLSLPVSSTVSHGSASATTLCSYSHSARLGYRLASEILMADTAEMWRAEILGLDSRGNPSRASVNGLPAEAYVWDSEGRLASLTVGGRLRSEYRYIPLQGLSRAESPSGLITEYEYLAGRLSAVKLNGDPVKRYEYSLCGGLQGQGLSTNGNSVAEWTLYGGVLEVAARTRFDAFGREIASGTFEKGGDEGIVRFTAYDAIGRKTLESCPFTASIGFLYETDFTDYAAYLRSLSATAYRDGAPFAANAYRPCADPAPASSTIPGAAYSSSPAKAYRCFSGPASGAKERRLKCRRFVPAGGGVMESGAYPDGALEITERADGDGRLSYTFADFRGRVVLERSVPRGKPLASNPSLAEEPAESEYLDTYYVYDDADCLLFVLPPLAVDGMPASGRVYTMGACQAMRDHAYTRTPTTAAGASCPRPCPERGSPPTPTTPREPSSSPRTPPSASAARRRSPPPTAADARPSRASAPILPPWPRPSARRALSPRPTAARSADTPSRSTCPRRGSTWPCTTTITLSCSAPASRKSGGSPARRCRGPACRPAR